MSTLRKYFYACTVGVVLLLIVIFAEKYFLARAEERGRKSGAAIQSAQDTRARDSALAVAEARTQARFDSLERAAALVFAQRDTVYRAARERLRTDTLFQRDTVFQEILAKADADVAACKDNVLACQVARANAEQDAARSRLTVFDRDTTILRMAHQSLPPPRSCLPQSLAGGVLGAAIAIVVHR